MFVFGYILYIIWNLKKRPSVKNISLKDIWVCPPQISVLYQASKQGKLGHPWCPPKVSLVQRFHCTGSERKCFLQAAEEGAEKTVAMRAKAGRASYVNVSRLVNPDPGAQAVALWMEAIYTALKNWVHNYKTLNLLLIIFAFAIWSWQKLYRISTRKAVAKYDCVLYITKYKRKNKLSHCCAAIWCLISQRSELRFFSVGTL